MVSHASPHPTCLGWAAKTAGHGSGTRLLHCGGHLKHQLAGSPFHAHASRLYAQSWWLGQGPACASMPTRRCVPASPIARAPRQLPASSPGATPSRRSCVSPRALAVLFLPPHHHVFLACWLCRCSRRSTHIRSVGWAGRHQVAAVCCHCPTLQIVPQQAAAPSPSKQPLDALALLQQEALAFMCQRENSNGLPPFWEPRLAQAGGELSYVSSVSTGAPMGVNAPARRACGTS